MRNAFAALVVAGAMVAPASAFAQDAAANCPALKQVASVPMTASSTKRRSIVMNVNGAEKTFLVDTGGVTALFPNTADDMNLPTKNGSMSLQDLNGNISRRQVHVETLRLGRINFSGGGDLMIWPHPSISDGKIVYDGIVAHDLFGHYDFELDFGGDQLNLFSTEHCNGNVVYWGADAVAVIPAKVDPYGLRVAVKLDGVALNAVIDTGSVGTLLNRDIAARKLGVDMNAPDVIKTGSGPKATFDKQFKVLELQGLAVKDIAVKIIPDPWKSRGVNTTYAANFAPEAHLPDIIIGMNVLSKLRMYVAVKEQKLYISPAVRPVPAP